MKKLLLILLCLPLMTLGQNVNIPDANFKAYLVGNSLINTNGDTEIQVSEAAAFSGEIDCYPNISDLTGLEDFTALTELSCSGIQLTSLDVSNNIALEILWCGNNQLTSLDVSANTALEFLYCFDNQLTRIDLSQNASLENLSCQSNQLTSLDLSQNTALTYLDCNNNQLITLDINQNTNLNHLNCGTNLFTSLNVSNNTNLEHLDFYNNQLTSIDLSQNTGLIEFRCGINLLTNLDLSQNASLENLYCQSNQLTSLDLSQNTALKTLFCSNNQLTSLDVSNNTALTLDVSSNTALTDLNCEQNQLTSLDVSNNTIGFGVGVRYLSVDINNGYLNLREKPDDKSRVIKKLVNNEILRYAGEWNGPWIKVVKSMGYREKVIIGWVHKDYVSSSNFKSRFLGDVYEVLEKGEAEVGCYMSGVEGLYMFNNIINLQGRRTILKINETENFTIYYNNDISIKLFKLPSIEDDYRDYQCLAIINYNGKEEVIFVKVMCGC